MYTYDECYALLYDCYITVLYNSIRSCIYVCVFVCLLCVKDAS